MVVMLVIVAGRVTNNQLSSNIFTLSSLSWTAHGAVMFHILPLSVVLTILSIIYRTFHGRYFSLFDSLRQRYSPSQRPDQDLCLSFHSMIEMRLSCFSGGLSPRWVLNRYLLSDQLGTSCRHGPLPWVLGGLGCGALERSEGVSFS